MLITHNNLRNQLNTNGFTSTFPGFSPDDPAHILAGLLWLHRRETGKDPKTVVAEPDHFFGVLRCFIPTDPQLADMVRQLDEAEKHGDATATARLIEHLAHPFSEGIRVQLASDFSGRQFLPTVTELNTTLREEPSGRTRRRRDPWHFYVE